MVAQSKYGLCDRHRKTFECSGGMRLATAEEQLRIAERNRPKRRTDG
jgi:hypothetical protein